MINSTFNYLLSDLNNLKGIGAKTNSILKKKSDFNDEKNSIDLHQNLYTTLIEYI